MTQGLKHYPELLQIDQAIEDAAAALLRDREKVSA
jgi:hypothetical protein